VARDIAKKIDTAWFAVSTPKGPAGLRPLVGTAGAVTGGAYANADALLGRPVSAASPKPVS
jgi:hypothetical protein